MAPKITSIRETLAIADIRNFLISVGAFTLASRALAVIIGFQIYQITHSVLSLGFLGLIEAIPTIMLAPFGGYIADHFSRRRILLITRLISFLCTSGLAVLSWRNPTLVGLYSIIFIAGLARGFADPASTALEAQVVPRKLTVIASSLISSAWLCCSVAGPAAIGFIFEAWGTIITYSTITLFFIISWLYTLAITPQPQPRPVRSASFLKTLASGWHFVRKTQPLIASMILDLFAVFFGGAIALLPVYTEILHVGAGGLGILNAAPTLGALIIMMYATKHPPIARAGRNLLWSIAGFGVSIIIFAFSKNFILSLIMLFFSGVFDGVSMVIRRSILRLLSPDGLRGRIAAVNGIFICASNELGALESGMLAALIGTIPCVAAGGIVTLLIVAGTALYAKQLRLLRFNL